MSSVRLFLARQLLDKLRQDSADATRLARLIASQPAIKKYDQTTAQFKISLKALSHELNVDAKTIKDEIPDTVFSVENKDVFAKVPVEGFVRTVLGDIAKEGERYAHGFKTHQYTRTEKGLRMRTRPEKVLVEFGSPNVAKPLHAGHLRSLILGQFISNINQTVGNEVLRLCYLGDWGTQFGLLATGLRLFGNNEKLQNDASEHLEDIYVKINQVVEEEGTDGQTYSDAQKFMQNLENGNQECVELWRKLRDLSMNSALNDTFSRLGVNFDHIEYESDYVNESIKLCEKLKEDGILKYDERNVGFIPMQKSEIILRKSDGTSLYLSRDLAAILSRLRRFDLDRVHYVVDQGQSGHFVKMRKVLELMGCDAGKIDKLQVSFGRVKGMSTRRGTTVHLDHVLNEAHERMLKILSEKSTTRTNNYDYVAENLALSAVFIQDMKEKRQKDYDFDWDRMLSNKGATGPFLQYGHARLASLESKQYCSVGDVYYESLCESEALRLVQHLSRFDQILSEVYISLEPHTLVHYLLDLVTLSNSALAHLTVKHAPDDVASARMNLFTSCRLVLTNGMKILGLEPLYEM